MRNAGHRPRWSHNYLVHTTLQTARTVSLCIHNTSAKKEIYSKNWCVGGATTRPVYLSYLLFIFLSHFVPQSRVIISNLKNELCSSSFFLSINQFLFCRGSIPTVGETSFFPVKTPSILGLLLTYK